MRALVAAGRRRRPRSPAHARGPLRWRAGSTPSTPPWRANCRSHANGACARGHHRHPASRRGGVPAGTPPQLEFAAGGAQRRRCMGLSPDTNGPGDRLCLAKDRASGPVRPARPEQRSLEGGERSELRQLTCRIVSERSERSELCGIPSRRAAQGSRRPPHPAPPLGTACRDVRNLGEPNSDHERPHRTISGPRNPSTRKHVRIQPEAFSLPPAQPAAFRQESHRRASPPGWT
jgi:hypothetical protein